MQQPTELTIEQLITKDKEIQALFSDIQKGNEQYEHWYTYFSQTAEETDFNMQFGYWRWFTFYGMRRFGTLNNSEFIDLFISRQIPMALILDEDVLQRIIWYLGTKTLDQQTQKILFVKARRAFFESNAIIAKENGEFVRVKDIVKEVRVINSHGNNSLELAKLKSRLESIFFSSNKVFERYIYSERNILVGRFIDLIHFFLGVDEDAIFYIVDAFLHPQEYDEDWKAQSQKISAKSSHVVEEKKPLVDSKPIEITKAAEDKEEIVVKEEKLVVNTVPVEQRQYKVSAIDELVNVEEKTEDELFERKEEINNEVENKSARDESVNVGKVMTHEQIKEMIESRFNKNENGEFTNVEGVLTLLGALSTQYNDPTILELYYYDEKEGKFKF
jgi:hypothetical protein